MCGGTCETPRPSLGGALVVLRPPPSATVSTSRHQDQNTSCRNPEKDHAVAYFPPSPPLSPGREAKLQDYTACHLPADSETAGNHHPLPQTPPATAVAAVTTTCQTRPVLKHAGTISGSLVFHCFPSTAHGSDSIRKTPANLATHMTFTPVSAPDGSGPAPEAVSKGTTTTAATTATTYMLHIHATGNLLDPAGTSPVLQTLSLSLSDGSTPSSAPPSQQPHSEPQPEPRPQQLPSPLEIGVGGDGIIGRRVTVWHVTHDSPISTLSTPTMTTTTRVLVAEGIIGFN